MTFESVLTANFDAVALLRCGHSAEALRLLVSALTAVQQAETDPYQPGILSYCNNASNMIQVVSIPLLQQDDDDQAVMGAPRSTKSGLSSTSSDLLFQRAFILEGTTSLMCSNDDATLCAAILLYNMALLFQTQDGCGPFHLRKACSLYQKVFSLCMDMEMEPCHPLVPLVLATVLNLIACQEELCGSAVETTQSWKRTYQELFAWACQDDTGVLAQQQQPHDQQEQAFDFMASCTLYFAHENLASAPAA